MKTRIAGILALIVGLAGIGQPGRADEGSRPAVVVELFTSQGCASCPPADRLLTELGRDGSNGVEVIPLSFHVDYWNYIGWTDPFSSPQWSDRQRSYVGRLASGRSYTPQLVVGGRSECVGSNRAEVARLIDAAAAIPNRGSVTLAAVDDDAIAVEARLDADASPARLLLVIFETDLTTPVGRGENAKKSLHNDHVVRSLNPLATITPGESTRVEQALDLDPSWRRENLGVAVLLQDLKSFEIYAARALALSPRAGAAKTDAG